ncbi:MAG: hypothetical protein U9Q06_00255 [Nanoarchaeota archaeon]|nr:hypothetical protein [Nanoarchaeota archaeon]
MINKKALLFREIALWVIALILLSLILGFLFGLPFLKWINYLPGQEESEEDLYVGVGSDYYVGDDSLVGGSESCLNQIGEISSKTGGVWRGVFEELHLANDERMILVGDNPPYFKISGHVIDGAEIYVGNLEEVIARVNEDEIEFNSKIFEADSQIRWMIWNDVFSKLPFSERGKFERSVEKLDSAKVFELRVCKEGDGGRNMEEMWPGGKIKELEGTVRGSRVDLHPYIEKTDEVLFIHLKEDKKHEGYFWIKKRKHGFFRGLLPEAFDPTIGVLFRDGSVWINRDHIRFMGNDVEVYLKKGLDTNFNIVEYSDAKFAQTNLYISNGDLEKVFKK